MLTINNRLIIYVKFLQVRTNCFASFSYIINGVLIWTIFILPTCRLIFLLEIRILFLNLRFHIEFLILIYTYITYMFCHIVDTISFSKFCSLFTFMTGKYLLSCKNFLCLIADNLVACIVTHQLTKFIDYFWT